jgi:hypothetical protein
MYVASQCTCILLGAYFIRKKGLLEEVFLKESIFEIVGLFYGALHV